MESHICHSGGGTTNTASVFTSCSSKGLHLQTGGGGGGGGGGGWGTLPSLFILCGSRGCKHLQLPHTTGYTGSPGGGFSALTLCSTVDVSICMS